MDPMTAQILLQVGTSLLQNKQNADKEKNNLIQSLLGSKQDLGADFATQSLSPNMSLSNRLMR